MVSVSARADAAAEKGKARGLKLGDRDWRALDRLFSIDTRALAFVRILLSGLILVEALFAEWFTYSHPVPAVDFLYRYSNIIIVPFAVMMLIGYKTRLATILVWVLYSIPQRSELLSGGAIDMGDYITVVVLLWLTLLPLGRHLSFDSRHKDNHPARFLSVASGGLLFQVFLIYFSAGLLKNLNEWVLDATAMETILSHPAYETSLGLALLDYPAALVAMSVATYLIEIFGALMVLIPGKSLERRRTIVVPIFVAMHVGIAALMGIGLFPYVMIAIWLLFLPVRFWDRVWAMFDGNAASEKPLVESSRWTNGIGAVLVGVMLLSNLLTWLYYPDFRGFTGVFQDFTLYLLMYQRWAMFAVPSTMPI